MSSINEKNEEKDNTERRKMLIAQQEVIVDLILENKKLRNTEEEFSDLKLTMANCLQEINLLKYNYEQMKEENEKYLEELSRIDGIFCDGENTHDDWMSMGTIAKKALQNETK